MSQQTSPSHETVSLTLRTAELLRISALLGLLGLLSACGGRSEQANIETPSGGIAVAQAATASISPAANPTGTTAPTGAASAARRGVLLPGLPGENAFSALQPYVAGDREAAGVHPAPLSATLDLAATVGQANAALSAIGARIVSMQPGHRTMDIELAPVGGGSPSSNQQAAASLLASHAFQWVQGPGLPVLPEGLLADPAVSEPAENLASRP
ncbi:MAG: hypothetical protein WCJ87_08330 [Burkholderiales bacterium]